MEHHKVVCLSKQQKDTKITKIFLQSMEYVSVFKTHLFIYDHLWMKSTAFWKYYFFHTSSLSPHSCETLHIVLLWNSSSSNWSKLGNIYIEIKWFYVSNNLFKI